MVDPILIVGPGAIGLLHAARMRAAGIDATLLDYRADRAQRLNHITLQENGNSQCVPVSVSADPAMVARFAHILVCVKAHTTTRVAEAIAPHVCEQTAILSLQNGLGNQEALATLRCRHQLRIAVTSYGARLQDESSVCLTGKGVTRIAAQPSDPVAAQWLHCLQVAGFQAEATSDVDSMLWHKLVLNAALNPTTALFGLTNGELPGHPQAWAQAIALLQESVRIAKGCGIQLDAASLQQRLTQVCQRTAMNHSSMLVDLRGGRETEVEAINGAIVRAATAKGLPAPCNRAVVQQIQQSPCQSPPAPE